MRHRRLCGANIATVFHARYCRPFAVPLRVDSTLFYIVREYIMCRCPDVGLIDTWKRCHRAGSATWGNGAWFESLSWSFALPCSYAELVNSLNVCIMCVAVNFPGVDLSLVLCTTRNPSQSGIRVCQLAVGSWNSVGPGNRPYFPGQSPGIFSRPVAWNPDLVSMLYALPFHRIHTRTHE